MKQLFANNAKAILASPIASGDTAIVVDDASKFPTPGAFEYFLVTIELAGTLEIIMITNRSGNTLTVGGLGRACEGTTASSFSAGARVEVRITRDSLDRKSTQLYTAGDISAILAPKDSYSAGYVTTLSLDPSGNPAIMTARDTTTWRFLNYSVIGTYTCTAATSTSLTIAPVTLSSVVAGKFMVQITSGTLAGQCRQVTTIVTGGTTVISWSTALGGTPSVGTTFELLEANISIIQDVVGAVALPVATNSGTANALAGTYFPAITSLTNNLTLSLVLTTTTTSTAVTFSVNGLAAKSVMNRTGGVVQPGELGGTIIVRYDLGTDQFWLVAGKAESVNALSFYLGCL